MYFFFFFYIINANKIFIFILGMYRSILVAKKNFKAAEREIFFEFNLIDWLWIPALHSHRKAAAVD